MLGTNSLSAERIIVPHPVLHGALDFAFSSEQKTSHAFNGIVLRYGEHFLTRVPTGTIN